jgi:hypothetical protein
MDFVEAVEFLKTVTAFRTEYSGELPKLQLYDAEKEGYVIWIRASSLNVEFLNLLKKVVEARGLQLRRSQGFLLISS